MERPEESTAQVDYQLAVYQRAIGSSEELFHRLALVQTCHEAVLFSVSAVSFLSGPLPHLLSLDSLFYSKSGSDLLESALVLYCLHPCALLDRFLSLITENSPVPDLMRAWTTALTSLSPETISDPQTEDQLVQRLGKESITAEIWDRIRLFACKVLTTLLERATESEYEALLEEEISAFLSVLTCPLYPAKETFLFSAEFIEVISELQSRVSAQRSEKWTLAQLKLITHFLAAFPTLEPSGPAEELLIETLLALGEDWYSVLEVWRDWYISIYNDVETPNAGGFNAIGLVRLYHFSTSNSPYSGLYFPCVLSRRAIFQYGLPLIALGLQARPEACLSLLVESISGLPREDFPTIQSPLKWVPEYRQWTLQFLKEVLDLRRDARVQETVVERAFLELMERFRPEHKCVLLRRLVGEYFYDKEVALVVEYYGKEMSASHTFCKSAYFLDLLSTAIGKQPTLDFPCTVSTAVSLFPAVAYLESADLYKLRWDCMQPLMEELALVAWDGSEGEAKEMLEKLQSGLEKLEGLIGQRE